RGLAKLKRTGAPKSKRARYPREELVDGKALFLRVGDDGSLDAIECIRERAVSTQRRAEFIFHRLEKEVLERAPLQAADCGRRFGEHFIDLLATVEVHLLSGELGAGQ